MIEETAELQVDQPNGLRLEPRASKGMLPPSRTAATTCTVHTFCSTIFTGIREG